MMGIKATLQEVDEFNAMLLNLEPDAPENERDYEWTDASAKYRACILLPDRQKNGRISPVFRYSEDLHEVKNLVIYI